MRWPGHSSMAPCPAMPPYSVTPSPEYEAQTLKVQAEHLQAALADVTKRLDELEAAEEKKH